MKKVILIIFSCSLIIASGYFFMTKYNQNSNKQNVKIKKNNSKDEFETFKKYNEKLVYDIYYFNPEDDIEEKRASLFERMSEPLVERMCPNIPELTSNMTTWNDILEVETVEIIDINSSQREAVTNYQIKTSEGQTFDLRSRAVYEKQENKWIMTDITPEERGG